MFWKLFSKKSSMENINSVDHTTETNTKEYEPIVFVNKPISDDTKDIVGFKSQIDTIKMAINNGANMIGIIADYGTGKSTISDMLAVELLKDKQIYNIIKINMWDSLTSINSAIGDSVSELTKSFLFQLAKGNENNTLTSKLSSYVSKRLSKNFNTISFSAISSELWKWCIGSGISFVLYKVFSQEHINFIDNATNTDFWFILKDFNAVFLIGSIICILFGLKNASIAFSNWKKTSENASEINDVFELYDDIANKLMESTFDNKQIIVVEDLDRIVDKKTIIGFLKEVYRFQNLLDENIRNEFVFIIAIKPEAMLVSSSKGDPKIDDPKVYSKIFDVILNLKPIHFEDYESVIIDMLQKDKKSKYALERLIGKNISDKLPSSFGWILKGENLTLRDLKDRLNHAISIMVSLKNKNYKDVTNIDFKACSAVAYLESQYPKDFYKLVKEEVKFEKLITESYKVKNQNAADTIQELENLFTKYFTDKENSTSSSEFNAGFISDFCHLISDRTFDDDFRMYFYTYPDGSYIKTTDEKDVCNLIKLPNEYNDYTDLDEKVKRIFSKRPNTIVINTINSLDTSVKFPKVILLNDKLFELATNYSFKNSLEAISICTLQIPFDRCCESIFKRLNKVNIKQKDLYVKQYIDNVYSYISNNAITKEKIYEFRKLLINSFEGNVVWFEKLFVNQEESAIIPIISEEEVILINNIDISLILIDTSLLTENSDYLISAINSKKLSSESYTNALDIYNTLIKKVDEKNMAVYLLDFLDKNYEKNDIYFEIIINNLEDSDIICKYVNKFKTDELSEVYLKLLDERAIDNGLSEGVLQKLRESNLYITYLLSKSAKNELNEIDYSDDEIAKMIILASKHIFSANPSLFLNIRQEIISRLQNVYKTYGVLFEEAFPLIQKPELNLFNNFSNAIICVDGRQLTGENYNFICEYCNQDTRNSTECSNIFEYLFNGELVTSITSEDITKNIFNSLDFQKIMFKDLDVENKERCIDFVSNALDLTTPVNCIACMKHLNSLVPSLELTIQNGGYNQEYISLLNNLSDYTDVSIGWLKTIELRDALITKLTDKLKEQACYKNYIIGKSLFDKTLYFDLNILEIDEYFEVYINNQSMFHIMSNSQEFIESVVSAKLYENITTIDFIIPLYKLPQNIELINYIWTLLNSDQKRDYIISMVELASEADSVSFQKFLCTSENIEVLGSYELKDKILTLLWESQKTHKRNFKTEWNRRWKDELKEMPEYLL